MRSTATLLAVVLAIAAPAGAQFSTTEVSGIGAPPFLISETQVSFEALTGNVVYNVYKRLPNDDFRCFDPDLSTNTWGGDPAMPASGTVWWYSVNAWDFGEENQHGNLIPILQPCHTAAAVPISKTATQATVAPGAQTDFTISIDNTAGPDLLNCSITDDVGASGCMTLAACGPGTPAIPGLVCDTAGSMVSATGVNVPAGMTQSLVVTIQAGATETSCDNSVQVTCGARSGGAMASVDIVAAAGCSTTPVPGLPSFTLVRVANGLSNPVHLTSPPGDLARQFIVEQGGVIRILTGGSILPTPFLDISARVRCCNERGLLSMGFHPQYPTDNRFFVYYTREPDGDVQVSEFQVTADPNVADPNSERILYNCAQPFSNHNGGQLAFSPLDGYLYFGPGDGGSGGDPGDNAENLGSCLGKLHRIDIDGTSLPLEYSIPADNPFLGQPGVLPEIWAYGLRNPWRFSFDTTTGDLYIGDVGQNAFEEVDVVEASSSGGEHYGWNTYEGNSCFSGPCSPAGMTFPVIDYPRSMGGTVVGGYVYRGCAMPGWDGTYIYGDYVSRRYWSFRYDPATGTATNQIEHTADFTGFGLGSPASFGQDAEGEVYILDRNGNVFKIIPQ